MRVGGGGGVDWKTDVTPVMGTFQRRRSNRELEFRGPVLQKMKVNATGCGSGLIGPSTPSPSPLLPYLYSCFHSPLMSPGRFSIIDPDSQASM